MYMDNIKLFAKNAKELETLIETIRIYSRNGIWHRKMCLVDNEEWKKTNKERNKTSKLWQNQNGLKKRKITSTGEYWKKTPSK